jgi:energy-coupling factor transporter ATP-binding protein EcfA2
MRIKSIYVENLFGMFDHHIGLKVSDRVTIIHGPNGVGKTTVLKLINELFSWGFHFLRVAPFKKIAIEFVTSPRTLIVEKKSPKGPNAPVGLKYLLLNTRTGEKISEYEPKAFRSAEYRQHFPLGAIEDHVRSLERIGPSQWHDRSTGNVLDLEEVLFKYGDQLPFRIPVDREIPKTIKAVVESTPTHFIQTQRLFAEPPTDVREVRHGRPKPASSVEKYSQDMAEKIQTTLRQSGVLATSLDRTFPHRLLDAKPLTGVTENRIRKTYEVQEKYRRRLMAAGLIEAEEPVSLPPGKLKPNDIKVLWYYLKDVDHKFDVFEGLLKRVELFKDIINTRFLFKEFAVDKFNGFTFTSSRGQSVPLTALSSGEQHELVLAYELLFRVKETSLILIDEPELSLHVTWQHKFLEDIGRISELADLDFLVATHSPSIIHKRSDLMVPLGGE